MDYVYGSASAGIYCRSGCCVKFKEEVRYPLAASAEAAGMRACLTCRPYRLPQAVTRGAPELVCRGVRLIVDGALDQDTENTLAARLGVSARQLRRLFVTHLGVTADGLARSCRAHFARRLLDDTDLSITEVVFAVGYGSVRQFNWEFRRIFRGTPSQLRASRSSAAQLVADGSLTLRLWFTGPLDWDALACFLGARAVPGVEHVDGQVYRRIIQMDGGTGVLELGPGGPDHLRLRLHLPRWQTLMQVAAQARKIAHLDQDPAGPARSLAADGLIGPLLAARPGVRVPGAWDPFEAGVAAIIGQQLAPAASQAVMARIAAKLGDPVPGLTAFQLTHTFPAPVILAHAGPDLPATGLTSEQAETLGVYASAIKRGAIRLDGSMPSEQLISSIKAVPGITASTADHIALRMGEPDAFPADDPILQQARSRLAGTPGPVLSHRWQPWRSYAAAHLWAAAAGEYDPSGFRVNAVST